MNRIIGAIAALLIAAGVLVGVGASPVAAGECSLGGTVCGDIEHYSPDDGLDSAIKIRCDYGDPDTNHWLAEGEHSTKYCKDTDRVHVADGEEIWCKYYTGDRYDRYQWVKAKPSDDPNNPGEYMDATGWYKINDAWNDGLGCTKRAD